MEKDLFFYLEKTLKARWLVIALSLILFSPLVVFVVHQLKMPFTAEVKIHAASSSPQGISSLAMGSLGSRLGSIDREIFINSQESLLNSQSTFRLVRQKLAESGVNANLRKVSRLKAIKDTIKTWLFGAEYVQSMSRYVDQDFLNFKSKLKFASELDAGSFTISVQDDDPEHAMKVAGFVAEALKEVNQQVSDLQVKRATDNLAAKIEQTRQELQISSKKIVAFAKENSFPNSEKYVDLRYQSFLNLTEKGATARAKALADHAMLRHLRTVRSDIVTAMRGKLSSTSDAKISSLLSEVQELELAHIARAGDDQQTKDILDLKLQTMRAELAKMADSAPDSELLDLAGLREQFRDVSIRASQIESELKSSEKVLAEIERQVEELKTELSGFPELQAILGQMLIDHSQIAQILTVLTEQYYVSLLQGTGGTNQLFVLEEPSIVPGGSMQRKPTLLVFLLAIVGCAVGIVVTAREFLRQTIMSKEQLSGIPNVTFVGLIPKFYKIKKLAVEILTDDSLDRLAYSLKKSISSLQSSSRAKTLVITGDNALLGKSFSGFVIGFSMSKKGFKTALLDADHRVQSRNLPSYVMDNAPVLGFSSIEELKALSAQGVESQHAPDIYRFTTGSDLAKDFHRTLKETLAVLRPHYDLIIIDSPPLFVSDSYALIEEADGIVLCCREGKTTLPQLMEAITTTSEYKQKNAGIFTLLTISKGRVMMNAISNYRYRYRNTTSAPHLKDVS